LSSKVKKFKSCVLVNSKFAIVAATQKDVNPQQGKNPKLLGKPVPAFNQVST